MGLDRLKKVVCPSVMKKEYALANTPQRSRAKFSRPSCALSDTVSEAVAHVVHEQVGEKIHRPVLQDRAVQCWCGLHLRCMT